MNSEDRRAVSQSAKSIIRAAQAYADANDDDQRGAMTDALLLHTAGFTHVQLVALVGDLANLLATFYGRDDLAASAEVTDRELAAWLAG
jgi:hypothetical protein